LAISVSFDVRKDTEAVSRRCGIIAGVEEPQALRPILVDQLLDGSLHYLGLHRNQCSTAAGRHVTSG
jgi:hypothetical protein